MPIKLVTLNIEGDKHINRFLPQLKKISPDVICFQEMFEADSEMIARELDMTQYKYVPTVKVEKENKYGISPRGNWGVCLMTKLTVKRWDVFHYSDFTEQKSFHEPNDVVRSVIVSILSYGENEYRVATTHFTWSPGGEATDLQRQDFARLKDVLNQYEDMVLCGDFNAPRGREIFNLFETLYHDSVPQEITTTIDPTLHYAGDLNLQLVVDTIFTSTHYQVSKVQVLKSLSDHYGIYGEVQRL